MNVQTHEQRLLHLEQANRVRFRRSQWKRRLREREASLVDVMGDPMAADMKVIDALLALPSVGRVRAGKVLRRLEISPTARLGALTDRQRGLLQTAEFEVVSPKSSRRSGSNAKAA